MRFPGVGDRIRQRLRDLGYWKAEKPDVYRFCVEKGYISQSVYGWLKNSVPNYQNLLRLSKDLGVLPGWLLLGEGPGPRKRKRKSGGQRQARGPGAGDVTRNLGAA